MLLIDLLKPETIVELGTQYGDSYCTFCQAVQELGLAVRCYAVDTWEGDPHAGFYGSEVLAELMEYHDPLYGSFSRLLKTTFDDALTYFTNGTIDLLHIDGYHTYEAVKHDFESWLPKMSIRGVVLFHDINVRERNFGVWKLWEEITEKHPFFEFFHGHGLGVLAVGKDYPPAFQELLEASLADAANMRRFFFQLGQRLIVDVNLRNLSQEIAQLQLRLQVPEQALAEKEEHATRIAADRDRLACYVTQLQSTLNLQQQALADKEEQANRLAEDRDRLVRDANSLQLALISQGQVLADKEEQANRLAEDRDRLARIVAELQSVLQAGQQTVAEKEAEARGLAADQMRLTRETRQLQVVIERGKEELSEKELRIAHLEEVILQRVAELNNIHNSHGWKALTAYYQLRNKLFPEGTRRRALAKFFWRSIWDNSGASGKRNERVVTAPTLRIARRRESHAIASFQREIQALIANTATRIYRKLPLSEDQRSFLRDKAYRYFWFVLNKTESYRVWCQLQQQETMKQVKVTALPCSRADIANFTLKSGTHLSIDDYQPHHEYIQERKKVCSDDLPNVDISLVTYNSAKWIRSFFKQLVEQSYPVHLMKVFVTDHGSQDETIVVLNELAMEIGGQFGSFQIYKRSNRGFGAGHNFNFKQGNSPYFLVSNVDLELESNAVEAVVVAAEADEESVASWEFRQKPYEHPKYYDPISMETAWSSHACVLLRRTAFERVGGYDEVIFMYGEDVELSFRLRDNRYQLKYCPRAVAWHFTYEYPEQVKPLQFAESTLNHVYIRLRYGRLGEILAIPAIYGRLFLGQPAIPRQRMAVLKNTLKIAKNGWYFLTTRKRSKTRFMFYNWDYELRRDGAFYHYRRRKADQLPLVSVVMRTFAGRQKCLMQAVSSAINQTYPKIELIIVEDGSNTAEAFIAKLKGSTDIKINYNSCEKRGRCHAGNVGLSLSTGEFISFLDDDDAFMGDHIEVLVDELLAHPESAAAYALSWEVQAKALNSPEFDYADVNFWTPPHLRQPFSREVILHHNYIPIQALLFRRCLYETYGGLDESMEYLEDWNLWVRYSSAQDFLFVEKTTSLFRTPHEPAVREKRHQLLHSYYTQAREKNAMALKEIAKAGTDRFNGSSWVADRGTS